MQILKQEFEKEQTESMEGRKFKKKETIQVSEN